MDFSYSCLLVNERAKKISLSQILVPIQLGKKKRFEF